MLSEVHPAKDERARNGKSPPSVSSTFSPPRSRSLSSSPRNEPTRLGFAPPAPRPLSRAKLPSAPVALPVRQEEPSKEIETSGEQVGKKEEANKEGQAADREKMTAIVEEEQGSRGSIPKESGSTSLESRALSRSPTRPSTQTSTSTVPPTAAAVSQTRRTRRSPPSRSRSPPNPIPNLRPGEGEAERPHREVEQNASSGPSTFHPGLPVDAPIQPRKYNVDSRTSLKPVPKTLMERRKEALEAGLLTEKDLEEEAARRRMMNTLNARESRRRKAEAQEEALRVNAGLTENVNRLKIRVAQLEHENEALRRRLAVFEQKEAREHENEALRRRLAVFEQTEAREDQGEGEQLESEGNDRAHKKARTA